MIRRRYYAGIKNLFEIYIPITDYWLIIDNSQVESEIICEGTFNDWLEIKNNAIFDKVKGQIDNDKRY